MRLFLAILPDDTFREELVTIQEQMKKQGIRGRYTDPFNLHMTLVFIGEYGNPDEIMEVLEEIPLNPSVLKPLRIERMRDLYVLVFEENEELNTYVSRIHRAFGEKKIPFDRKSFLPHITLVRKAEQFPSEPFDIPDDSLVCDGVSLMLSQRGKNGMVYTEIDRIEL